MCDDSEFVWAIDGNGENLAGKRSGLGDMGSARHGLIPLDQGGCFIAKRASAPKYESCVFKLYIYIIYKLQEGADFTCINCIFVASRM